MRLGIPALVVCVASVSGILAADAKPAPAAPPAKAAPAAAKPTPAKSISGKVTRADGKPAPGATVRAIPMPPKAEGMGRGGRPDVPKAVVVKTDAAGAFQLEGLAGGPFTLRVEAAGFAPASASDVPLGAALNLRLKPGVTVVGRVLDLTSQKPVAGAVVTGLEKDGARFGREAAHTVTSADDGTFQIADCATGIVVVEAIAPGKARARLDRVVAKALPPGEAAKPDTNTLFLQPGGRIAGRTLGPDGKPLVDAVVTASASDGSLFAMLRDGRSSQRTDADGKFAFDGVAAGNKYTVRATKEGLTSKEEGPIPIDAGTDRGDLELKLESGALLTFKLLTAQDLPVKDVEARLQPQTGRRRGIFSAGDVDRDKIQSQGEGKFLIKSLDAGTFDLTLLPPDYADVSREGIKLKSGETLDLGTIRVKESKSIAGRIADTNGQPVAGATISAMWVDPGDLRLSREARSGADGRYRLSGLGEQQIRDLTVRAQGFAEGKREGATPGDTAVDFTLEKTGSIIGRVQLAGGTVPAAFRVQAFPEAKEGQERPGFRVVIGGRPDDEQIFTDPSGNFRLDNVEPGSVTISAKADGKAPGKKTGIKVASDQVTDVGTVVLEDGRTLRGRVVAAKDDAPVPGATVTLQPPQGMMMMVGRDTVSGMAISTLDGRFEISGLEARTYAIDVGQPDYSPNSGRVEIAPDADTDDFVVKLSRGGTITGLVRDAQKQPVTNAGVLLTKVPMGGGPQTVTTGSDGRYTFEKIAPGQYMVMRAPTGGGPLMLFGGMKQADVREGETTVFDLDDASKITVSGRVTKAGQPVANAMMFFSPGINPGAKDLKQSHTDADGRYQIGLDAAGTYSVVVSQGAGFFMGGGSGIQVEVQDQPNSVVDIAMKSAGISGHVTNADGKPIANAVVSLPGTGTTPDTRKRGGATRTEPDGTFLLDGLDPGTYTATVSASGYLTATSTPVTIANDNDVPSVDIRMEPGRSIRGRVLDASGNGIADAMVMSAAAGNPSAGRASPASSSDVNGTFVITVPADGPIDVTAVAAGFPPAHVSGVQPQEGEELTLRTPRPGRVKINVLDGRGNALRGATVQARAVPDYLGAYYLNVFDRTPPTADDGTTTVSTLGPGAYELTIAAGAKHASQSVTVAEGQEVVTTVTLP